MKKYYPFLISKYFIIEFLKCLCIILTIFLSLGLLINFIEELIFFKDKNISNLILTSIILTLYKTPNTIIETSVFIFLFSGIFFFVRFLKNSEINTLRLSGISNFFIIMIPSIFSFIIGLLIIFIASPISSNALTIYEKNKRLYSQNDNLIVINDTGLWFMEKNENKYNIVRADKLINNDFTKLYNSTIYVLDEDFNFLKRYDSKLIFINKKKWTLEDVVILDEILSKNKKKDDLILYSSIEMNQLKELFTNVDTVSFFDIFKNIKKLNDRGYSADELKIKYHKYLSLPIYLFLMVIISTFFTINSPKNYSNFTHILFGIICGILIYFFSDLSIALGKSNKIPLFLSVWIPIFTIIVISIINLIQTNEK